MKSAIVHLLSYTPDALNLLLKTKGTRLAHTEDPASWPESKKQEHLAYMRDTIKSSWEFVDYTFKFEGVTRAFTHQLVRTRSGSYAQESQRTVDVRDHEVVIPSLPDEFAEGVFDSAASAALDAYGLLLDRGVPAQDARGVLPTNTTTSIIAKFNLRTLSEMAKVRLCTRTQGEYQKAFRQMRQLVVSVHPWAAEFIEVHCVATGTCAFPRYGKSSCGFYDARMDTSEVARDTKAKFGNYPCHDIEVAVPVAKDGRTM